MSDLGQLSNPHPASRCPHCGAVKPCVGWSACSSMCADLMRVKPKAHWALPEAPVGPDPVMAISWQPGLRS